MISNPTSTNPKSFSFGPTCSQIHKSFSVSDLATAEAPAAKFPLSSPSAGTLATAASIGLPLINKILLSPSVISGMYVCIITFVVKDSVIVSRITFKLGSEYLNLNIEEPPIPSKGLITVSP